MALIYELKNEPIPCLLQNRDLQRRIHDNYFPVNLDATRIADST